MRKKINCQNPEKVKFDNRLRLPENEANPIKAQKLKTAELGFCQEIAKN